ncbi:MAG: ComF family protein [Firmicutes bacterium]|nr:ComF family protein [Bacillota bacterium]
MNKLFNAIFPNFGCLACDAEINVSRYDHLCDGCMTDAVFASDPVKSAKAVLGNEKPFFCNSYAPFNYQPPISDLVLKLKYNNEGLAAEALAPHMKNILTTDYDIIIPVPLTKNRVQSRGYNQAELLANAIFTKPVVNIMVLQKVKTTTPQVDMTHDERRENQRGAFSVISPNCVSDKTILIVDDILTSGATLNECARVLMDAGARVIDVLTVARTSR